MFKDTEQEKIRVGVLRGGPSSEYEVSLQTGGSVLKNLPDKYIPTDVFIDRQGVWHVSGVPKDPHNILQHTDVVFNALHGEFGEDGKVQSILESFNVPYTGSDSFSSNIGMNKLMSKQVFKLHGLKTPHHVVLREGDNGYSSLFAVYESFSKPCIVKPAASGSSVGVTIVREGFDKFQGAVEEAFKYSSDVIVEQYIEGREATCGVIDSSRDEDTYSLLPVEIIKPDESDFFDYEAKYSGKSQEICPGDFSDQEREGLQTMALKAHKVLGLRHYSRSDFIVDGSGNIYLLESNTLPGLTPESLFPKSLAASGCELHEFLDHLIVLAMRRHG